MWNGTEYRYIMNYSCSFTKSEAPAFNFEILSTGTLISFSLIDIPSIAW